jgi:hypothetical protein
MLTISQLDPAGLPCSIFRRGEAEGGGTNGATPLQPPVAVGALGDSSPSSGRASEKCFAVFFHEGLMDRGVGGVTGA